ncbi:hypothetical protein CRG98_046586 [Punica granatum]|uniref:Uncharacterized protein n=1 Tax=Punica granatum TaxID=22663 RepID=A0A2I0HMR9_PUNGR|nr:hypothetical protein CRG98_046586 [Punica granatum]
MDELKVSIDEVGEAYDLHGLKARQQSQFGGGVVGRWRPYPQFEVSPKDLLNRGLGHHRPVIPPPDKVSGGP